MRGALIRVAAGGLLAAQLQGCAVGPDYARPSVQAGSGFGTPALGAATAPVVTAGGESQRFDATLSVRADWWTAFGSPKLNELIARALAANPNVEAAQAALRAADALVQAQRGQAFPTLAASYTPSRTKIAGNQGGNSPGVQGDGSVISAGQGTPASAGGTAPFNAPVIYNFHTAQLSIGYAPDVFGSNRRQVESLQAQADVSRFQLQATVLTLSTNLVAAAVQDASLRRQIALSEGLVAAAEAARGLVQRQLQAGYASRLDLANQDLAVAQARAALPGLRKQLEQNRDLLRALAGQPQDAEVEAFSLDELTLPQDLPMALPSQLLEQRPDLRAAEAQLQSASALVGVAAAARLPQFSLSANAGGAAANIGQMFWDSGRFFDLALNITQPLFDAGTIKQRERAAQEGLQQAAALYRSAIVSALQNVADTLHALQSDARALQSAAEGADGAARALALTRRQHASGYLDRLALISAEQGERQAQLALAQARAQRLVDTASLFMALGGGWWNATEGPMAQRNNFANGNVMGGQQR